MVCLGYCQHGPDELVGFDWVALSPDMVEMQKLAILHAKHTSLLRALQQRDTVLAETLIRSTPELLQLRDSERMNCTLLHSACLLKYDEVVEIILDAGYADINAVDEVGATALHCAAQKGFCDGVKRIVAIEGCDVNIACSGGFTALMRAVECNHDEAIEITKILLEHPTVDVNAALPGGPTVLFMALSRSDGGRNIVELIASHTSLLKSTRDDNGMTALLYAAMRNITFAVVYFLSDPEWQHDALTADGSGCTGLIYACMNGNMELVENFLRYCAADSGRAVLSPEMQVAMYLREEFGKDGSLHHLRDPSTCVQNFIPQGEIFSTMVSKRSRGDMCQCKCCNCYVQVCSILQDSVSRAQVCRTGLG